MNDVLLGGSLLLFLGLAGGCAPKVGLHTETQSAAIRGAEEVGAASVPVAALHLQLAKEQVAAAEQLHADGDLKEAESMLQRAEADAELALVLARHATEQAEAEAAVERVRVLRIENNDLP